MPGRRADREQAVLYLRQSVTREESVSLEQQETACRDYCATQGYLVAEVVADPGISGRKWRERHGVHQAMAMLEDRRATVLVCWKWSRVSRDRLDFEIAMGRADDAGARIEAATEPIDVTTASGRLHRGMLAEFAAFESRRIGEEWRMTHARRRAKGQPAQGGERYGYRRVRSEETGKVVGYLPDPTEAEVLRWMYEQVIGGRGASWVANELNRRGVPNPRGNPWAQERIYRLLDAGFAAGLIVHRRRDVRDAERVYHPGDHPPLIDETTWERYLASRRRNAGRPAQTVEPRYPLTGLVKCGDCGAGMWPTNVVKKERGHSLICGRWRATGQGRCVTAVRARVEDAVKAWLREYADNVEAATVADRSTRVRLDRARRDARAAMRAITDIEAKLAKLNRAWLEGAVPDAGYAQTRDELLAELKNAQDAVEAAQDYSARPSAPARATAKRLLEEWDESPATGIRNVLITMIARVEVHPPAQRGQRGTVAIVPAWDE